SVIFLRLMLGAAFLNGIASRFGLYGKNAGYGNYANYLKYAGEVNSFMPSWSIPYLAKAATVAELSFGLMLVLGLWVRWRPTEAQRYWPCLALRWRFRSASSRHWIIRSFRLVQALWSLRFMKKERSRRRAEDLTVSFFIRRQGMRKVRLLTLAAFLLFA